MLYEVITNIVAYNESLTGEEERLKGIIEEDLKRITEDKERNEKKVVKLAEFIKKLIPEGEKIETPVITSYSIHYTKLYDLSFIS